MTGTVIAQLPGGEPISLGCEDARRLVEALWGVSMTRGAVVAIGKIEHRLSLADADSPVEISELEMGAIRAALAAGGQLTPALARLQELATDQAGLE